MGRVRLEGHHQAGSRSMSHEVTTTQSHPSTNMSLRVFHCGVLVLSLLHAAAATHPRNQRVVCYYDNRQEFRPPGPWRVPITECTHFIYVTDQPDDSLGAEQLKSQNSALKVMASLQPSRFPWFPARHARMPRGNESGEAAPRTDELHSAARRRRNERRSHRLRRQFAENVTGRGLDGLDVRWAGEGGPEVLQELRGVFDEFSRLLRRGGLRGRERLLLSQAVSCADAGRDVVAKLTQFVDFFNVNASMLDGAVVDMLDGAVVDMLAMEACVGRMLALGVPSHKIVLGIATFGVSEKRRARKSAGGEEAWVKAKMRDLGTGNQTRPSKDQMMDRDTRPMKRQKMGPKIRPFKLRKGQELRNTTWLIKMQKGQIMDNDTRPIKRQKIANRIRQLKMQKGPQIRNKTWSMKMQEGQDNKTGPPAPKADDVTADRQVVTYRDVCTALGREAMSRDSVQWSRGELQGHGYSPRSHRWLTFHPVAAARQVACLARASRLGGVMYWSLTTDDVAGACGMGEYPLLTAGRRALVGDDQCPGGEASSRLNTKASSGRSHARSSIRRRKSNSNSTGSASPSAAPTPEMENYPVSETKGTNDTRVKPKRLRNQVVKLVEKKLKAKVKSKPVSQTKGRNDTSFKLRENKPASKPKNKPISKHKINDVSDTKGTNDTSFKSKRIILRNMVVQLTEKKLRSKLKNKPVSVIKGTNDTSFRPRENKLVSKPRNKAVFKPKPRNKPVFNPKFNPVSETKETNDTSFNPRENKPASKPKPKNKPISKHKTNPVSETKGTNDTSFNPKINLGFKLKPKNKPIFKPREKKTLVSKREGKLAPQPKDANATHPTTATTRPLTTGCNGQFAVYTTTPGHAYFRQFHGRWLQMACNNSQFDLTTCRCGVSHPVGGPDVSLPAKGLNVDNVGKVVNDKPAPDAKGDNVTGGTTPGTANGTGTGMARPLSVGCGGQFAVYRVAPGHAYFRKFQGRWLEMSCDGVTFDLIMCRCGRSRPVGGVKIGRMNYGNPKSGGTTGGGRVTPGLVLLHSVNAVVVALLVDWAL